ncbi:MAG: PfkB family carbohydrate kinase [Sediminibacterium sp.]|nr:PfkB family carbohydrate kinase [Sediminibacterium sp.]
MTLTQLLHNASTLKIGIVGDLMLDTYWQGSVNRLSPEAPVPIVNLQKIEHRAGGSGNVALNCQAFGAKVTLFSLIGKDEQGLIIQEVLKSKNINIKNVLAIEHRKTTQKTRILAQHQQITRIDYEDTEEIGQIHEKLLVKKINEYVRKERPQLFILQDYNKGVLTASLIKQVIDICNRFQVVSIADPKIVNFFEYKHVTIFKPNLKEALNGVGIKKIPPINLENLASIHKKIHQHLQHQISIITLSEHGLFFQSEKQKKIIPTSALTVSDVSGAGDTVVALVGIFYVISRNIKLSCQLANIGAGIVCSELGTSVINKEIFIKKAKNVLKEK